MKKYILILAAILACTFTTKAQNACPTGSVCLPQETANRLYTAVDQLIAAKDTIAKLMAERGTSDVALANALKVIEKWEKVDQVNELQISKYKEILVLYEQSMKFAFDIIDRQQKQLMKGKSSWDKVLGVIKRVGDILVGVALGRVL